MRQTLQLKLSQQLRLTPQLQQSIRLLQLSTLELNQEIERIVQENPLLELDENWGTGNPDTVDTADEIKLSESIDQSESLPNAAVTEDQVDVSQLTEYETEWSQDGLFYDSTEQDENEFAQIPDRPTSLRDYLYVQAACLQQISERERQTIELLIDSLDDDGYLQQSLEELAGILPLELNMSLQDLQGALNHLQQFDPAGVGARDLQECLLLQLNAMPDDVPFRDRAQKVVQQHLKPLAAHDFTQIKKLLGCDDETLRATLKLIFHLNPKPGSDFNVPSARYIIPDIIVKKKNGTWVASLNIDALPKISINRHYANILKHGHHHSTPALTNQLNEAKWLIKNIQQRSGTILAVANAIIARQHQFLEHGEVAMRPLVLREIADALDLHESTISRVTTQKFMHTPRGIFELKYFFGSHVSTDSGGACSATAIRALIKQLINEENSRKPLSDSNIAGILEQQGIVVARRTVAKYRESLQIPAANLRKSF